MEIVVGKTAGFCYGVKKAVNGAIEELKNNKDVYCLGEIVHNRQVIKELEDKGMNFIEKLSDSKGTTIIRAHGVPKEIYEYAKNNKAAYLFVNPIQKKLLLNITFLIH